MNKYLLLPLLLAPLFFFAQKPAKPNSADLQLAIKKLNVLGTVLYVAAHPDDENTRMISYMRNEKLYDVTYLSLTRGDGGQNLIGPEIRELLGVLRTEELLMARSVDGGQQLFTRANDFGYSKTPEETLAFWDKEAVLSDVVWAYRKVRPDVVINRFSHDKNYSTHGHHTSSAILSVEAFDLAGNANAYPEQLSLVQPWKAQRQFFNTSSYFYGGREAFKQVDKSGLWPIDIGVWLPLKGKSNGEIAAESRSMHRCQGFGMLSSRGSSVEYLDFVQGRKPTNQDVFQDINTTWTRVPGGGPIGKLLAEVDKRFRADNPAASIPDLLEAMQMIKVLPTGFWRDKKLDEIKSVIRGCLGLYLEATADEPTATPGEMVNVTLECISRAPGCEVNLVGINIKPAMFDTITAQTLTVNEGWELKKAIQIPANAPFTSPYWLGQSSTVGMYQVADQKLRGLPETPRYVTVGWVITVNGRPMEFETEVAWKTREAAVGEVWRPFEILPPVFVEFTESSYLFTTNRQQVTIRVKAGKDNVKGKVRAMAPGKGWIATSDGSSIEQAFEFSKKGEEKDFTFQIQAPDASAVATLSASAEVDGKIYTNRLINIKYDHIPQQSVMLPATAHAARFELQVNARNVGYYMGAGDDVPAALHQMGCKVTLLTDKDLEPSTLNKLDAVVFGIRAYNTKDDMVFHQQQLLDYVKAGGTMIVQYNTNHSLVMNGDQLAPYPIELSRTRVTDETAEVRFKLPSHPVLNQPNKLTTNDFDGWVQERGLYFPSEWDDAFEAPLSMNDPGEDPSEGSLLVAKYGKGHYVYTGISFFRELPAGVPGAYRLFANLLSLNDE